MIQAAEKGGKVTGISGQIVASKQQVGNKNSGQCTAQQVHRTGQAAAGQKTCVISESDLLNFCILLILMSQPRRRITSVPFEPEKEILRPRAKDKGKGIMTTPPYIVPKKRMGNYLHISSI